MLILFFLIIKEEVLRDPSPQYVDVIPTPAPKNKKKNLLLTQRCLLFLMNMTKKRNTTKLATATTM